MDLLSPNFRKQLSHSSVFLNIKESFLGTWNVDITPSCTDNYSLLGVTIRKKWSLAQNSWFIDLKFNRNSCNRWESYCSLTHTKWVSSWCFPSQGASVQWLLLNTHLQAPGAAQPHSHPAGQNFVPTSGLDSCQPSWKLAPEMDLQLGRQGHCFHTQIHLLNAKELFLKWEKHLGRTIPSGASQRHLEMGKGNRPG